MLPNRVKLRVKLRVNLINIHLTALQDKSVMEVIIETGSEQAVGLNFKQCVTCYSFSHLNSSHLLFLIQ